MKLTTRRITFAGILAAIYAALTLAEGFLVPGLAYGTVQFRFAEALSVLCCFTPAAIPGMVVGCIVANINSTLGIWDIVLGSLATLLACLCIWKMSGSLREERQADALAPEQEKAGRKRRLLTSLLIPLPTIVFNAVIVGAELGYYFPEGRTFLAAWGINGLFVAIGEAVVTYALGVPLLFWLLKNKSLSRLLRSF